MDFPFEYVERVTNRPIFDHHLVSKAAQDRAALKCNQLTKAVAGSEEDELDGVIHEIVKQKEKVILKEITKFESIIKKTGKKEPFSSECSSSDSMDYGTIGDTSDTYVLKGYYKKIEETGEMAYKKFKIMRECWCTDSECKSKSELSISTSTSSTCTSSDDAEKSRASDTNKKNIPDAYGFSSEETSSSSEDEMNMDDEIEYLEGLLDEIKKAEDKKIGTSQDGDSEDSDDDLDSLFEENKTETAKSSDKSAEKSKSQEPTPVEPKAGPTSLSLSQSSTTVSSSEQSPSDSTIISSSDPNEDNSDYNFKKFNWQSDDLYKSTDTDSEIEQILGFLGIAMAKADGQFSKVNVNSGDVPLLKEKFKNFQQALPVYLKTKKSYEIMEEPELQKQKFEVISKQLWLVQQLDSGIMCSAKLVSRKNPEHLQLQINLDKERKLLYKLLPELSRPSHIARLLDVGFDENFKYLIFEDLGMDLLTLFEEFGPLLSPSTLFLITYFTFNSIKELHSFDILHLDIRPSTFSVTHHPFNIKIIDYSKCIHKRPNMRTPEDAKPDSFSPRVFHKKNAEFDKFVDFESWVYTMVYLCTNVHLNWFGDQQNMLEKKEEFLNDPGDIIYDGCVEAVPMAAHYISNNKITYEYFLNKMNLVFSVDVMKFSDKDQPMLWSIKELDLMKKDKKLNESDDENEVELIESHWNPADESDTDDGKDSDDELKDKEDKIKESKEEAAKKEKNDKRKTTSREERSMSSQQSSEISEPTSNAEQWSEASSGQEESKPEKIITKKNPTPRHKNEKADHMMLVEPLSGQEQFSMPSSSMAKKKDQAKEAPKFENKKAKDTEPLSPIAPKGPKGKKNRRPLLTRQFLFEMKRDLRGAMVTRSSSDSSVTSISTWTSSTLSSDDEIRFKWSLKSEDESGVEYFEDLTKEERDRHRHYENLVALCLKDDLAPSSNSEIDPLSDIEEDEEKAILKRLERRSEEVGWELYSDKEKSREPIEPDDFPKEIKKDTKKETEKAKKK